MSNVKSMSLMKIFVDGKILDYGLYSNKVVAVREG